MSYRAIGSSVSIFRASVQRTLERFETTDVFQSRSRCGRLKTKKSKKCSYAEVSDENRSFCS